MSPSGHWGEGEGGGAEGAGGEEQEKGGRDGWEQEGANAEDERDVADEGEEEEEDEEGEEDDGAEEGRNEVDSGGTNVGGAGCTRRTCVFSPPVVEKTRLQCGHSCEPSPSLATSSGKGGCPAALVRVGIFVLPLESHSAALIAISSERRRSASRGILLKKITLKGLPSSQASGREEFGDAGRTLHRSSTHSHEPSPYRTQRGLGCTRVASVT